MGGKGPQKTLQPCGAHGSVMPIKKRNNATAIPLRAIYAIS